MKKGIFISLGIIIMGIIYYLSSCDAFTSSMQSQAIVDWISLYVPVNSFIVRKFAHFSLYFILSIALYIAGYNIKFKYPEVFTFLVVSLYAISDEIHQHFVPGRSCEIRDILIDITGCVFALSIIKTWRYFICLGNRK